MNKLKHLAIIMDGNGRWAKHRNKIRSYGHEAGSRRASKIRQFASDNNIKYLTLYAFSTENWQRSAYEVNFLMKLLNSYLKGELPTLIKNEVKFETIGDTTRFSPSLQKTLKHNKFVTQNFQKTIQTIAINYGAKDEMCRAIDKCIKNNQILNEENIKKNLDSVILPNVDLLIRTAGDKRISNYLLWKLKDTKIHFTNTLWPDFTEEELSKIIKEYNKNLDDVGGGEF